MQTQRDEAQRIATNNQRALERFKAEVAQVASREAIKRSWCEEIDEILTELGLERVDPYHEVWVAISVQAGDVLEARQKVVEFLEHRTRLPGVKPDTYGNMRRYPSAPAVWDGAAAIINVIEDHEAHTNYNDGDVQHPSEV